MLVQIGEKMFLEVYFQYEENTKEDYLDDLNELNRVSLLDDLHKAKELLGNYDIFFMDMKVIVSQSNKCNGLLLSM